MPSVLITGANRGLGLEHARQYLDKGWEVLACCRSPEKAIELNALAADNKTIKIYQLDVTNHSRVEQLATELAGTKIDVLLNNAGILGADLTQGLQHQTLSDISYDLWRELLEVNVLAPFKIISAFQDHVASSDMKVILMMSSGLGSISGNTIGGLHAYRTSKTSLNMLTKGLAAELEPLGITIFSMAPGWCKTDMGTELAEVEVADSVAGQQQVVSEIQFSDSGSWFNYSGELVDW